MNTRQTIDEYFQRLAQKRDWPALLSEGMVFTSFTSPNKELRGRAAYLEGTKRFYSMIESVEVRDLIVEGAKACAFTRYRLRSPRGDAFTSDVAERFTVKDGAIDSLGIHFDSAPFPK
jgi:ketosteroid isomerase-like protein